MIGWACPLCGKISYNLHDEQQRFCGWCSVFVDDVLKSTPNEARIMMRITRDLSDEKQTEAAQRQADTWKRRARALGIVDDLLI